MASNAWREVEELELWKPEPADVERRRRPRRGGSPDRLGPARWVLLLGVAWVAFHLARAGYRDAAKDDVEGVYALAYAIGIVLGGLTWFR